MAQCHRAVGEVLHGRVDEEVKHRLCVNARSTASATCIASAPTFLSTAEKISLCMNTDADYTAATRCIELSIPQSKLFVGAPKKSIALTYDAYSKAGDLASRKALVDMCSYTMSQDPRSSAECFRQLPKTINHDSALRICTNVSSIEVMDYMKICRRLLPTSWSDEDALGLCDQGTSREQVRSVVTCATTLSDPALANAIIHFDIEETKAICKTENSSQYVTYCFNTISKAAGSLKATRAGQLLTPEAVASVCKGALSQSPGHCFTNMIARSGTKLNFDSSALITLCKDGSLPKGIQYTKIIPCLEQNTKTIVTTKDVERCIDEPFRVGKITLASIQSLAETGKVTAGKQFSVNFDIYDQWGSLYLDDIKNPRYTFTVSINDNNEQGAILWGTRRNSSLHGALTFSTLVLSQPGQIEFKVNYKDSHQNQKHNSTMIFLIRVKVYSDPDTVKVAPCVYLFKESLCPVGGFEDDWNNPFPRVTSYIPPKRYLDNLFCQDLVKSWHVDLNVLTDGSCHATYRSGIDAIWTGIGLPRVEMTPSERLGLPANLSNSSHREIKRAYYKKSLQWHPDRWIGMEIYSIVVTGVFELIAEAIEALNIGKKMEN